MLTWIEQPEAMPIIELPNDPKWRLRLSGLRSDGKLIMVIADIDVPGSREDMLSTVGRKLTAMRTQIDMYLDEGCKCSMPKEYQKEPCTVHGEVWNNKHWD